MKRISAVAMAAFYVVAGANHFAHTDFSMPMMPPYVPWHRAMVYLSDVAEVLRGSEFSFRVRGKWQPGA